MKHDSAVRELAKLMFLKEDITNKDLAARLEINEKTVAVWRDEDKWDAFKKTLSATKEEEIRNLYEILAMLNKQNKEYLTDGDPETQPDTDGVIKLAKAIKYLETQTSMSETYQVMMAFVDYVMRISTPDGKLINAYADKFIKTKLNGN